MMSHWITNHGLTGEDPVRMGTGNSILFPLRVFETKTKPIYIAGTNDPFWKILCKALGCEEWLADARFATNEGRVAHRAILEPMMEAHFAQHTCEALLDHPAACRHAVLRRPEGERPDGQRTCQGARQHRRVSTIPASAR